jgi:isoleucyl-tRNA synthetase
MVGLASHDRAPYDRVITHGWVINVQGEKMSKSQGTGISPNEVVKESGAEILRLWVASSNYQEDVRVSEEILHRISDAYRKMRNTARYALGNLDGFDPARDGVPVEEMLEIDRWALEELDVVAARARAGYEAFEFFTVYHALYNFCTVTLSARYFDIIKDRLYTAAPRSHARRSAQTALYRIVDALARMLAPILVFTADEIWENLPKVSEDERAASVHMAEFTEARATVDSELLTRWTSIFEVRDVMLRALEEARGAKTIGSSLEAKVIVKASGETFELLRSYAEELRYIFIVSQVELIEDSGEAGQPMTVEVLRADGEKCERCWNYSVRVGESERYPNVCERCVAALTEIEGEQRT